jgi:hypothetical protein
MKLKLANSVIVAITKEVFSLNQCSRNNFKAFIVNSVACRRGKINAKTHYIILCLQFSFQVLEGRLPNKN